MQMLAGELKQTAARTDDLLKSCDHNLRRQQQQLLHRHHHQRWKANEWPLGGFELALLSGDREGEEAEDGVAEEEEQTPVGRQESCSVQFEVKREDGATLKRQLQQPSRTEPFEQLHLLCFPTVRPFIHQRRSVRQSGNCHHQQQQQQPVRHDDDSNGQ